MLENIEHPLLKQLGLFPNDLVGRGRNSADIHVWPDHSLCDPLGRWYAKYPRGVLGKGDLPCLLEEQVLENK
ncbi:MAG: hypothetical protein JRJ50_12605 [Deltaproteobacteria bacterium]|nr:hypothetical protein [Deltaproteobacteria bacterium]